MKKLTLLIITYMTLSVLNAQVINTERLRIDNQEDKWEGSLDAAFNLLQNKSGQSLTLSLDGRLGYTKQKSKWMFLTGYNRRTFSNTNVLGRDVILINHFHYAHLRYNYNWKEKWTVEAFVQEQFDRIHEIDLRILSGTGLRWQLLENDSSQLYLGALYMYEIENTSPNDSIVNHRDHRMSTYLSSGFKIKDYLTINNIIYYQPNLLAFDDFRILLETRLSIKLTQKLSLITTFNLIYDSEPPLTIPPSRFNLSNGFVFVF